MAKAQATIMNFLSSSGYPVAITGTTLKTPMQKEFKSMFLFIYEKLDPQYVCQNKFENEVPEILKSIR